MIERGTFDWRFWLTLSLALMVLYLAYLGMVGVEAIGGRLKRCG